MCLLRRAGSCCTSSLFCAVWILTAVMDAAVSAPCLHVAYIHVLVLLITAWAPLQPGLQGWGGEAGFLFVFSLVHSHSRQLPRLLLQHTIPQLERVESGFLSHSLCPPLSPCQGAWEAFRIT